MFNTKKEVLSFLHHNKHVLTQKYGIRSLILFGSFAQGNPSPESDIDLLIDMQKEYKKYRLYCDLKNFLTSHMGRDVDLVFESHMNPIVRKFAEKDFIYVD